MTCYTLQLMGDGLPTGAREVPLSDLVSTFLPASAPRDYYDACLAVAVREPVQAVHRAVRGLTELAQFTRKKGRYRTCRSTKRIVARAEPRPLQASSVRAAG